MDVLTLEGKDYVKSSVIARELGYTSDYVGQLCRSGKVDAKLFGRTWYVNKNSLSGHKTTRYRSSKAVSQRALHAHIESNEDSNEVSIHVGHQEKSSLGEKPLRYGYFSHIKNPRYVGDHTELVPKPERGAHKIGKLAVSLAEGKKIGVEASKDTYAFQTPSLPEIRFKGRLKLSEIEEEPIESQKMEQADREDHVQEQIIKEEPLDLPKSKGKSKHLHPVEVEDILHKKPPEKNISLKRDNKKLQHIKIETLDNHAVHIEPNVESDDRTRYLSFKYPMWALFLGLMLVNLSLFTAVRVEANISYYGWSLILDNTSFVELVEVVKNIF